MRLAILMLVLMSVVAQKPVPPIVVIPPDVSRHWQVAIPKVTRPSDKDELTNLMLSHPKEALEGMHEYDIEICQDEADPVTPMLAPAVQRCTGVI